MRPKRKAGGQITGDEAVSIVKRLLPLHWTIREYHPDFGLDLAIELFEEPKAVRGGNITSDALGEHIFVQVKGARSLKVKSLKLFPILNVEKFSGPSRAEPAADINAVQMDVISFALETSELVTIQRMGSAVPVLLVLVDTGSKRAFFVCLNDYLDKVILPIDPNYATRKSKTIHVPQRNEITDTPQGLVPLRFYGKRAKLMAAFQKFSYQKKEIEYTRDSDLLRVAQHFATIDLRYDFWDSTEFWFAIHHYHQGLLNIVKTGFPSLMKRSNNIADISELEGSIWTNDEMEPRSLSEIMNIMEMRSFWEQLANLGMVYEEVCREWFLPTHFSAISS